MIATVVIIGLPRRRSDRRICLPMQEMQEMRVPPLGGEDFPGEGNGNPLQYSCLGNPIDRGAWPATVRGVAESDRTDQLTLCFSFNPIHREAMNSCGACALRRAARAVQHCAHLKMFVYVCRCWVCRCEGFPSLGKLVGVCGLLIAVASLVAEHGL